MHSLHLLRDRFCATTKGTANRKRRGVLIQCNTVIEAWTVCVGTHWWHTNPDLSKDIVWEGFSGGSDIWAKCGRDQPALGRHGGKGGRKNKDLKVQEESRAVSGTSVPIRCRCQERGELDGRRGPTGHLMWVASQTKSWEQRELLKAPFHTYQIYSGFTGDIERLTFLCVCVCDQPCLDRR